MSWVLRLGRGTAEHPAGPGEHPVGPGEDPVGPGKHPAGSGEDSVGSGEHPVGSGEHPVGSGEHPAGPGEHPVSPGHGSFAKPLLPPAARNLLASQRPGKLGWKSPFWNRPCHCCDLGRPSCLSLPAGEEGSVPIRA